MTDHAAEAHYLPGMGRQWLLGLYDPLTRVLGVRAAHRTLAAQAGLRPGMRALEIGCGTGNLVLHLKRRDPGARERSDGPLARVMQRSPHLRDNYDGRILSTPAGSPARSPGPPTRRAPLPAAGDCW